MKELKHIDVLSLAKVSAVLSAIWGFIAALLSLPFLAYGAQMASLAGAAATPIPLMAGIGVLIIVVMPILMAIMGFVMGAVGAFLYNVVAGWVGGVKLDL